MFQKKIFGLIHDFPVSTPVNQLQHAETKKMIQILNVKV